MMLKPLCPKTLLSPPFRFSLLISHFSTSHAPYFRRHHDEESRNVRVCVWWDFENCNLPAGVNVFKVAQEITKAVRVNGIKGPVQITAFGDVMQLSRANQEALSSTGINLAHIPSGGKNSADRSLLIDLMYWVSQNPPPAHLFLISGDRDFANILHRLRMNNYNILLATRDNSRSVLCSAASIMWNWNALVRGENLTGRHFNEPPDGSYGSWYGHSKVPLEDPFSVVERPTCSRQEELSGPSSEPLGRPIPKAIERQIHDILSTHPKGMSIGDLRSELVKSAVPIDKDLYGYKKFTHFLLAMPNILNLDGSFTVRGVFGKVHERFKPNPSVSSSLVVNNGSEDLAKSSRSNIRNVSTSQSKDLNSSLADSPKMNAEELSRKVQQSPTLAEKSVKGDIRPPEAIQQPNVISANVADMTTAQLTEGSSANPDSASEVGIFKKFWRRFSGIKDAISETKSSDIAGEPHSSADILNKQNLDNVKKSTSDDCTDKKVDVKDISSQSEHQETAKPSFCSNSSTESTLENKNVFGSEACNKKSVKSPGLFSRIATWCKFWPNSQIPNDEPSEVLKLDNGYPEVHQVFAEDSFWREMESFVNSLHGSLIITQSKTRQLMAQNLLKEGPLVLRSLSESDVLKLVEMLLSEKKWIEECPSEALPFKVTRSAGNDTSLGVSSSRLRSIILGRQSQSDLHGVNGQNGDGGIQDITHAGVSTPVSVKKTLRSRKDILEDCKKLANDIVKEFPEGYDLGSFRRLFLEKYGYYLDMNKLGYKKLASLLQTFPEVRVESSFIIPSSKALRSLKQDPAVSDSSESLEDILVGASKRDDESDSQWEELGPVTNSVSRRKKLQSSWQKKASEEETSLHTYPEYESAFSDDGLSDSEGESSTAARPDAEAKSEQEDDDSSLVQVLNKWYGSKESKSKKGNLENVEGKTESNQNGSFERWSGKDGLQQRPKIYYSFVEDPHGGNKEKLSDADKEDRLLNGILNLKVGKQEQQA